MARPATTRAHVVMPRELAEQVDELVGERGRSRFIAEAVAEKLARLRLLRAAEGAAGSLKDVDIPGWETRESTEAWIRQSRMDMRRTELESKRETESAG